VAEQFLEPHERLVLDLADQAGIVAAGARLARTFRRNRLLPASNSYANAVLRELRRNARPGRADVDDELTEYVAASSVVHCADGWSYLGRGIAAHLSGHADIALHMAYYAELRAAIAALHTHGIAIFNDRHIIVNASGATHQLRGKRTHLMTWLALEDWANSGTAAAALAAIVTPFGVPLDQWVTALPGNASWNPVGQWWFSAWGVDLSLFGQDRDARNESSYRPTTLTQRTSLPVTDAATFVRDLWELFEPSSATEPFLTLDLHLLRRSLELAYRGVTNQLPSRNRRRWAAAIDTVLASLTGASTPAYLRDFLLRVQTPADPAILSLASRRGRASDPRHHLRVLARAALLLRVASGCVAHLARLAGLQASDFNFWMSGIGESLAIWDPAAPPSAMIDLWLDTDAALQDLDAEMSRGTPPSSYRSLQTACPDALHVLAASERVALWSVA
jgi:hypothetical protein